MSPRIALVSLLAVIIAAGVGSYLTAHAQTIGAPTSPPVVALAAPQVWEQSCVSQVMPTPFSGNAISGAASDLDALVRRNGQSGWELVSVSLFETNGVTVSLICFKRPARS